MDLWLISGTLCLVVIFRIALAFYRHYLTRQKYKGFPDLCPLPIIGDSWTLMKMTDEERQPWFESIGYRFRRKGLFLNWIGTIPIVHIYKPEYLEVIFSSTVNIDKGKNYDMIKSWLGKGLITSTGAQWFHDRRLISPTFHFNILNKFAMIFSEKAEILIKCLEKETENNPGEPIDILPLTINVALDIICETAMGVNVRAQEVANEYCSIVQRATTLAIQRSLRPWYWTDWIYFATSTGQEYKRMIERLHSFTKEVISKKKAARRLKNGLPEEDEEDKTDIGKRKTKVFLDLLLDQNETENALWNDDELRAQVDTFMFAGHDTTAIAITWALFCLGNYPEYQEKVHEELESVFGDSQTPAGMKELSQLKYLDRVMKETLRLFPSVPTIMRTLVEDVKIGDYNLEKGTIVALAIFLAHRNPQVWPDPLRFDPDRFLPENSKGRHPYAYVPFSAGPRNCVGQRFAALEEKTVLTAILRKWRVESAKTLETIEFGGSVMLRPYEKVLMRFKPKK